MNCPDCTIGIIELVILAVSVILVLWTLISTQKWNKKKVSQEILDEFIVGNLPDLVATIRIKFKCNIYDKKNNYLSFVKKLNKKEKDEYDDTLIRILNIYEVIAINIKNKIINEKICFDYISLQYTAYYKWSLKLIKSLKILAKDKRVYEHFTSLAEKWLISIKSNK